MDDLPILPFEKMLSHLSLEELVRSRAVSRRWCQTIDSFKKKSLLCSDRPIGFIYGKSRWMSGAFAQNFIGSPKFGSFISTFGPSIFSNLKHLCLCEIDFRARSTPVFSQILASFGKLEELDIIGLSFFLSTSLELNLPMLVSIQIEDLHGIQWLTLDAPRLQKVKLVKCFFVLDLVHDESVEGLIISNMNYMRTNKLKNLKLLYLKNDLEKTPSTFLSSLEQLKEIHLNTDCHYLNPNFRSLFEQQHGRADLKVYLRGFLLNGPNDPAIDSLFDEFTKKMATFLAENLSRLADEIRFYGFLYYSAIEVVSPESAINIVKRLTDLQKIIVDEPVQDVERFLDFLHHCRNLVVLAFRYADQPQDLFVRLPDHCTVQVLTIEMALSDFQFILRLQNLTKLKVWCPIGYRLVDEKTIRKILEELPFLSLFDFKYVKRVRIKIDQRKQFKVRAGEKCTHVSDVNAVIQFIRNLKAQV